jgi:hypothetical protein
VEKVARKFRSFAEADKADREFYQSLTPEHRLDILGEMILQKCPDWTSRRIERIGRKIKLRRPSSRSAVGEKSL